MTRLTAVNSVGPNYNCVQLEWTHGVVRCSIVKLAISLGMVLVVGCSGSKRPSKHTDWEAIESVPQPSAPASPIENHVPAALAKLEPVIIEPESESRSCALRWTELDAAAPKIIELAPANGQLTDECADGFDPKTPSCADGNDECIEADMRGGQHATLSVSGPAGSGHFASLGLAVDNRFVCLTASTVGWRYLFPVGTKLAPLPWLADVDGDGDAELVVWQRLPWGDAEVTNGLVPVVYSLDGDRLVRQDDRARALRVKVADAYHDLVQRGESPEARSCFVAMTVALGG
jgi:hypothetical protein